MPMASLSSLFTTLTSLLLPARVPPLLVGVKTEQKLKVDFVDVEFVEADAEANTGSLLSAVLATCSLFLAVLSLSP